MATHDPPSPRYRLGKELGHGGIGRVVEAWDDALERQVAVKLILQGLPPELQQRFVREARLSASLEHPNIVPVYDFGAAPEGEGELFLAMKRIRGRDLGQVIREVSRGEERGRRWSRGRLLGVFQGICLGMAYAHSRGIIHRDLKPANVMIGEFGEVLIVDWGLAKMLSEGVAQGEVAPPPAATASNATAAATLVAVRDSRGASLHDLTIDGDLLGTPAYMPPEQALGRLSEIDERSDVFALGAILFEILSWRPPHSGRSVDELLASARTGVSEPPSARARAAGAPPVPPELDSICARALAFRKENRYATAMELHDDVQLFVEGVKEAERRRREAAERVERARERVARARALQEERERRAGEVNRMAKEVPDSAGVEAKRPLWEAQARLRALRDESLAELSRAESGYEHALTVDAECVDARDGKCELLVERYLAAERRRDQDAMLVTRVELEGLDLEGKHRAQLDAPGRLTIRAWSHACRCVRPQPGLRTVWGEENSVPWRDGRPKPGPMADEYQPIPPLQLLPEGARWGHGSACRRDEVPGVEVRAAKYEVRDKRLVPGTERRLGTTPLPEVELSQGSWLVTLHHPEYPDTRLPVRIERSALWAQDVNLYRPEDLPGGFCFVPGGPFLLGGLEGGGRGDLREASTEDFLLAKFPVTSADYLEFLNALPIEEARKRQPREGDRKYWAEENGRFRLPDRPDPPLVWEALTPVLSVSWLDAMAYCAWRSEREGRPYRLAHEVEWEKAARGVDGRVFPYGNELEHCYSHLSASVAGGMRPLPVGSFPADESPYGVRDLAGGAITWCLNGLEKPFRTYQGLRGGSWCYGGAVARSGYEQGNPPVSTRWSYGFRLALSLTSWT